MRIGQPKMAMDPMLAIQPEWQLTLAAGIIHAGSEKVIADARVTGYAALMD